MLEFLSQSWVTTIVGILFGFIGSYILYKRILDGGRLVFQHRSFRLIEVEKMEFPQQVRVLFDECAIPRLTRCYVVLWNNGTAKIEGKDVVSENLLRLEVDDGECWGVLYLGSAPSFVHELERKYHAHDALKVCRYKRAGNYGTNRPWVMAQRGAGRHHPERKGADVVRVMYLGGTGKIVGLSTVDLICTKDDAEPI